ncbi:MAG: tetratricopeptide repeat-containing sensor histidine kinase [Bacteroidota bacterium]
MRFFSLLIICLFIVPWNFSYCNDYIKDTTEFRQVIDKYEAHIHTNKDSALLLLEEAYAIAKRSNYTAGLIKSNLEYGWFNMMLGNYEIAEEKLKKSLALSKSVSDSSRIADSYSYLAMVESEQGNYDKGLTYFLKVEEILKEIGDPDEIATLEVNIARLYYLIEEYEISKTYYKNSIKNTKRVTNKSDLRIAYQGLSSVFEKLKDTANTLKYAKLHLDEAIKTGNDYFVASGYHNLGTAYDLSGEIDSASVFWKKAQSIYIEIEDSQSLSLINLNIAHVHLSKDEYNQALKLTEESIEISKQISFSEAIRDGYKLLAEIYFELKNYKEAYKNLDKYIEIREDFLNENVKKAVVEVEKKYESKLKDEEIERLKNQDKINQLEINKKENEVREQKYLVLILTLLVVSLIIGFLFYRKSQSLKKEKVKRKLEQQVFRTQMNPHFIFNSLNSIQRMYVEGNTDDANDFLTEFSGLIRNILENSNHNKIALNEEISTLRSYLELEKLRTKDKFDFAIDIDESIDQYNYKVPPLVIQPFVENAIWHGILPGDRKGEIQIKLTKFGDRIHVEVLDNGVGFSAENTEKHESHGIKITEKRIGSKVNIQSSTEGTKIDFTI